MAAAALLCHQVSQNLLYLLRVRSASQVAFLGLLHLGSRHHLHGLRDLGRGLDAAYAPTDYS
jgi:hypothetical protein